MFTCRNDAALNILALRFVDAGHIALALCYGMHCTESLALRYTLDASLDVLTHVFGVVSVTTHVVTYIDYVAEFTECELISKK